jgi:molybdopterin converting factor small subunit
MPAATVRLSASITYPQPEEQLRCDGATVEEVLQTCCSERPGLQGRILGDEGGRGAMVFLNGRSIDQFQGLQTEIREGDTVLLLVAIAGG